METLKTRSEVATRPLQIALHFLPWLVARFSRGTRAASKTIFYGLNDF
jgi:hypothetical protein